MYPYTIGVMLKGEEEMVVTKPKEGCEHNWQPGDLRSDWICSECGERSNIPEYEEDENNPNYNWQ